MTIRLTALADNTGGTLDVNGTPVVTINGTGISVGSGRRLAQTVTYQTGAVATGSTILPNDDTVPQSNEGDQYLAVTLTPINALSTLEVDTNCFFSLNSSGILTIALFQDSGVSAIRSSAVTITSSAALYNPRLVHAQVAGTTTAITFKIRAGVAAAGTNTLNGINGIRRLGETLVSSITVKEYLP